MVSNLEAGTGVLPPVLHPLTYGGRARALWALTVAGDVAIRAAVGTAVYLTAVNPPVWLPLLAVAVVAALLWTPTSRHLRWRAWSTVPGAFREPQWVAGGWVRPIHETHGTRIVEAGTRILITLVGLVTLFAVGTTHPIAMALAAMAAGAFLVLSVSQRGAEFFTRETRGNFKYPHVLIPLLVDIGGAVYLLFVFALPNWATVGEVCAVIHVAGTALIRRRQETEQVIEEVYLKPGRR